MRERKFDHFPLELRAPLAVVVALTAVAGLLSGAVDIGLFILLLCLPFWLGSDHLVFEEGQRYRIVKGVWPFVKTRQGSFDDIRQIEIGLNNRHGKGHWEDTYPVKVVFVSGKGDPYTLTDWPGFDQAAKLASEISILTGKPVDETLKLSKRRAGFPNAPYDSRLITEDRTNPQPSEALERLETNEQRQI